MDDGEARERVAAVEGLLDDVEQLASEDDVVRLALRGSCSGCPSSTATLKLAIEDAIHRAAPDVAAVVAEGAVAEPAAPLLQIDVVAPRRSWSMAGGMPELRG